IAALQGAFSEHLQLLRKATTAPPVHFPQFNFIPVRTPEELALCDALILPGGESTTISLIAERSNLLEPLRQFVKLNAKPVWGTCAGMILLSERANRTKRGGQQLIGGLDVVINRNHFGRQIESFECALHMPFLEQGEVGFRGVFIRAPVVENLLDAAEAASARIPRGNIVAVRQGNVVGTSFHPELTSDVRMHRWWLGEVVKAVQGERERVRAAVQ
ncbi:SNO glutamine amidotransferase, partial [Terfezia boudieri ATCC MYA-4762]